LSEPIDVYSDWVDACEALNKQEAARPSTSNAGASSSHRRRGSDPAPPAYDVDDEDDDDLGDLDDE
ncbi:hypothetical protein HK405_012065, partial [Cladochytrium tenue]